MNRMTPTRRDVLRWGGLSTSALLVGCGDNELVRDAGSQLASAVVEPESDSFLVTVWGELAGSVALEVQTGDAVIVQASADLDQARRATFDVGGLAAGALYRVRVVA